MVDIFCLVHSAVRFPGSRQLRWLGLGCVRSRQTHLMPNVCSCHVLRILAVAVCKIREVCRLPFAVCRRLRIRHFLLIVWILVLLKKLIAEMCEHRALWYLGIKMFLRFWRANFCSVCHLSGIPFVHIFWRGNLCSGRYLSGIPFFNWFLRENLCLGCHWSGIPFVHRFWRENVNCLEFYMSSDSGGKISVLNVIYLEFHLSIDSEETKHYSGCYLSGISFVHRFWRENHFSVCHMSWIPFVHRFWWQITVQGVICLEFHLSLDMVRGRWRTIYG